MISLIRKHQPFLMVMITILVIVSFVWFYNVNRMSGRGGGGDAVASVYGSDLTQAQIDRIARKYYLAGELGLYGLLESLGGGGERAIDEFLQNSIVLSHEADVLQIHPTEEEVKVEETHLPVFQTGDTFDPDKLAGFIQDKLMPKGFGEGEIDELIVMDLQMKKVKELIGSSVTLPASEVRSTYDADHRKMVVSVIRFRLADFAAGVQLSEADLKKAFDQRKQNFNSEERRKVDYVVFALSDTDKILDGKEKNDAMGRLANRASDFTEAMTAKDADFGQLAAKSGVAVQETPFFSAAEPPKEFDDVPAAVRAAFQMTMADPNSDAFQGKDSFYVLHLKDIAPSRPLTFEQARAKLEEDMKNERARETMSLKAADIRGKILADMKSGKSFADAAQAVGQKAEAIPPFSLADVTADKTDLAAIAQKAIELSTGQLSDFSPTQDGGMLLCLEKFLPPDPAQFAKDQPSLAQTFLKGKQEIAFHDWLRIRRMAARPHRIAQ